MSKIRAHAGEQFRCSESATIGPVAGAYDGEIWDTVIMAAGLTANTAYFDASVLERRADIFTGSPIFCYEFSGKLYDHLPNGVKDRMPNGVFRNKVGFVEKAHFGTSPVDGRPAILGRVRIQDVDTAKALFRTWHEDRQNMPGLSVDIRAAFEKKTTTFSGGVGRRVLDILKGDSVDIVSTPAAGGEFARLVASKGRDTMRVKLAALIEKTGLKLGVEPPVEGAEATALVDYLDRVVSGYGPANTIEEQNFSRALILLRDKVKEGRMGEAVSMLDNLIGGTAYNARDEQAVALIAEVAAAVRAGDHEKASQLVLSFNNQPGEEPAKETESMPDIQSVDQLRQAYPALIGQIEEAVKLATKKPVMNDEDEVMSKKAKQALQEEAMSAKRDCEAARTKLSTVETELATVKASLDSMKAENATRDKQSVVERAVQSSKLSKIKDPKLRESWLSKDFVGRLTLSKDEAEMRAILTERETLFGGTVDKTGMGLTSFIEEEAVIERDTESSGLAARRAAAESIFGVKSESAAGDTDAKLAALDAKLEKLLAAR